MIHNLFFRRKSRLEVRTILIEIVSIFIAQTRIKSVKTLETVLAIMLKSIAMPPNYLTLLDNLSEECKLNVIECIEVTFRYTSLDVIEQFYTKENMNKLAQFLMISIALIKDESYRALRLKAVQCIQSIFWVHDDADHGDIVLRAHIADVLFLIIPKVLGTMCDIATGDETQGDALIKVIGICFMCWTR